MAMGTHNIQEDITKDILTRLPVKSLLRFKRVSKFWNTLISQPYFKRKHLKIHSKNENSQKMLIGQSINRDTFYSSSSLSSVQIVEKDIERLDLPLSSVGTVYCCCDGLFLLGLRSQPTEYWPSILLLWNPSTRETIMLPHLELPPEESESVYGLGYDSISDDYKVLRIDLEDDVHEILALKSDSWRKLDETASSGTSYCLIPSREGLAFVHGSFHWYGVSKVVALNISNEMYGEIPFPHIVYPFPPGDDEEGISVLGGMLCFFLNNKITCNLWVMKEYGVKESWTKLFSIPSIGICLKPLYRFSSGEVLLSYMTDMGSMVQKISDGLSSQIWPSYSDGIHPLNILNVFVYVESLISPKLSH